MSAEQTPQSLTRSALKGLALPADVRDEKLDLAPKAVRDKLLSEMGAIQHLAICATIWIEQGTWDEVLEYLTTYDDSDETEAEAA